MAKAALHSLCIGTVQIAVITAYKAFEGIFIGELLFDLGFVLQAFVTPLNDVRGVNAFTNYLREFVKLIQAFLGTFKDPCKFRIALFMLFQKLGQCFLGFLFRICLVYALQIAKNFLTILVANISGNCPRKMNPALLMLCFRELPFDSVTHSC